MKSPRPYLKPCPEWWRFSVNALTHILVIFVLLSSIFLFYLRGVEKKLYQSVLKSSIGGAFDQLFYNLDESSKASVSNLVNDNRDSIKSLRDYYASHKGVAYMYNNVLLMACVFIIGVIVVAIACILLCLRLIGKCDSMAMFAWVLHENFWLILLAGIVEVVFFQQIASKYVPFAPSYIENQVYDTLRSS
jgi:hypothetical protein